MPLITSAVAKFDDLLSKRAVGTARGGEPLDAAIARSREVLRDALFGAGVRERRAMLTGSDAHASEYAQALKAVDAAYADLWAYEAFGRSVRVTEVDARRAKLTDVVKAGVGDVSLQISEGRPDPSLHATLSVTRVANTDLRATWPLPESAIEVPDPGPMKVGGGCEEQRRRRSRIHKRLAKSGGSVSAWA